MDSSAQPRPISNFLLDHSWQKVVDVLIATGGLWTASVLAEFIAHLGAHQAPPTAPQLRHLLWVSGQIMAASAVPPGWRVFAFPAVRSTPLRWWSRILLIASLLVLGLLVVFLDTLDH